jgi:hypothetical protein
VLESVELAILSPEGATIDHLKVGQKFRGRLTFRLAAGSPPVDRVTIYLGMYRRKQFVIAHSKSANATCDSAGVCTVEGDLTAAPFAGDFHVQAKSSKDAGGYLLAESEIKIAD